MRHGLLRPRGLATIPLLVLALVAATAASAVERAEAEAIAEERAEAEIDREGDIVNIFSGGIHIPAGTRQRGDVVCLGGRAVIEGDVSGDVVVVFGTLELSGRVEGQVVGVMTDQRHRDAEMHELINVLGSLDIERTRVTAGELINVLGSFASDADSTQPALNMNFGLWLPGFTAVLAAWRLLRLFAAFVLLVLICTLVPERVRAIGEEAPVRYLPALLVGLLAYLALLVVVPLLAATVVGLPLAYVGYQVFKWLGIAGLFYAVGRRVGRSLGREMSPLGAVLLCFGPYAIATLALTALGLVGLLLSVVFWIVFLLTVEAPALGLVLLTRVGTRAGGQAPFVAPDPPAP